MDIKSVTNQELFCCQGIPVRLELHKGAKAEDIFGNVYTIDPETRNVVLVQFDESEKKNPARLVVVPSSAIRFLYALTDDQIPAASTAAPKSDTTIEQTDSLLCFGANSSTFSVEEVVARKLNLVKVLETKNIPFTEEPDGSIVVGAVKIASPYQRHDCFSDNLVSLERTCNHLKEVLNH